jgi:hypothetical protein
MPKSLNYLHFVPFLRATWPAHPILLDLFSIKYLVKSTTCETQAEVIWIVTPCCVVLCCVVVWCDVMWCDGTPTFRRTMLPPSSEWRWRQHGFRLESSPPWKPQISHQVLKLLIMHSSPVFHHFFSLSSTNSPQQPVPKLHQSVFLPYRDRPSFTHILNKK